MELVLNRRIGLFEQLQSAFQTEQDNIFFEKAHGQNEPFQAVLSDIMEESGIKSAEVLVIVDPYFTNIGCSESEQVAEEFLKWIEDNKLRGVEIYTKERKNCFENRIKEKSNGAVRFHKPKRKIHDRFWVFIGGGLVRIVAVGASFNGFVNGVSSLFYVTRVKEEDQDKLICHLKNAEIYI